ncbi:MAG: response regulator [bacterium]|nr:response regulator [bacterium]
MTETKKRVLIVDDDPDFRFQERVQLEAAGYEVIEADSRAKASQMLPTTEFDLAMVDLMMEEFDAGFSLCHEIKAKDSSIPVIMITGVTSETGIEFDTTTSEERSWIKADAMLAKPVRFEQLTREIKRLLKG